MWLIPPKWLRVTLPLGSFGAFFQGRFFHLKWISNMEEIINLNFSRSSDDLKVMQRLRRAICCFLAKFYLQWSVQNAFSKSGQVKYWISPTYFLLFLRNLLRQLFFMKTQIFKNLNFKQRFLQKWEQCANNIFQKLT